MLFFGGGQPKGMRDKQIIFVHENELFYLI